MNAIDEAQQGVRKVLGAAEVRPAEAAAIMIVELVNHTVMVPMADRMKFAETLAEYFLDRVRETLE
jgi:hypothetical protein